LAEGIDQDGRKGIAYYIGALNNADIDGKIGPGFII
jgi:hypothetical protein